MIMIVIGLVGKVGAGKSTVARMLADRGATVLDADLLAHESLAEPAVVAAIIERFGNDVLDGGGRVRRSALAEIVFAAGEAAAANLRALEAIVHPRVRERLMEAVDVVRREGLSAGHPAVVVLDVPLLMQAGWGDLCDRIVMVECEESVRTARLVARGWPAGQIAARDAAWERGYVSPRLGPTTFRVDASADPAYTQEQVDRIWETLGGS